MYRFELSPSISNPLGGVRFVDVSFLAKEAGAAELVGTLDCVESEQMLSLLHMITAHTQKQR